MGSERAGEPGPRIAMGVGDDRITKKKKTKKKGGCMALPHPPADPSQCAERWKGMFSWLTSCNACLTLTSPSELVPTQSVHHRRPAVACCRARTHYPSNNVSCIHIYIIYNKHRVHFLFLSTRFRLVRSASRRQHHTYLCRLARAPSKIAITRRSGAELVLTRYTNVTIEPSVGRRLLAERHILLLLRRQLSSDQAIPICQRKAILHRCKLF